MEDDYIAELKDVLISPNKSGNFDPAKAKHRKALALDIVGVNLIKPGKFTYDLR